MKEFIENIKRLLKEFQSSLTVAVLKQKLIKSMKENKLFYGMAFVFMVAILYGNLSDYFEEDSFQYPALDRSADVQGPDVNHNGIRDDLDAHIANYAQKQHWNELQLKAVQEEARAMQAVLMTNPDNKEALLLSLAREERAGSCLASGSRFGVNFGKPELNFEKLTINTKQRMKAYIEINRALSGSVWSTSNLDGSSCVK